MTEQKQKQEQEHHGDHGGVRERLEDAVHAVQEAVADRVAPVAERMAPVAERVAPAVEAVTAALHEAGHTATHLVGRHEPAPRPDAAPELGPVPSGTRIVRPAKGSATFLAWRDGQWTPVHREQGVGWIWSA